jgi:ribokinase
LITEARHVILARGALGALLVGPDGTAFVRSVPVDVVDTTAAGDAFNGAFACALGRGTLPEDAVRQACIAAALSTTRLGAQPSLPTTEELRRFVEHLKPS